MCSAPGRGTVGQIAHRGEVCTGIECVLPNPVSAETERVRYARADGLRRIATRNGRDAYLSPLKPLVNKRYVVLVSTAGR